MRLLTGAIIATLLTTGACAPEPTKLPTAQAELIPGLAQTRSEYRGAESNAIAQAVAWQARRRVLCALGSTAAVDGWSGRVHRVADARLFEVGPVADVSLTVEIGPDVWIETYGAAIAEKETPTNIKAGSDLHRVVSALRKGDRITFNGEFITHDDGCAIERSLTRDGSMRAHELIFRFSRIESTAARTAAR
jgi:hypothetical protein